MSDTNLPMFEDLPTAVDTVAPKPKKQRKARKAKRALPARKAVPAKPDRGAAIRAGIRKAKKARVKAKRRGQPAGSVNKRPRAAPWGLAACDLSMFAEVVLGQKLAPWQLAALEHFIKGEKE
jgi:hypothetical protein